jgi:hypothetical protein
MQEHLSVTSVSDGLRGTIATNDIAEGQVIAHLPAELIIELGPSTMDAPVSYGSSA